MYIALPPVSLCFVFCHVLLCSGCFAVFYVKEPKCTPLSPSLAQMPIIQSATNSPATSFGYHKREAFPMSHKQQRRSE